MFLKEIKDKCTNTHLVRHGYSPLHKYINTGKNETDILNKQEIIINNKIQRSYKIGKYYVDGYCPDINTVFEVYEKFHKPKYKKIKDEIRQKYIQNKLKCTFVIIWDLPETKTETFIYIQ